MSYVNRFAGCREFVNADLIAAGLSPFNPESQAFVAGRLMLERMQELTSRSEIFAFETTLAGRGHAERLRRLKHEFGYSVVLFFVWLPNADFAVARVAIRVRQGGHSIPEATIRRRFRQGIHNFANHYSPLADRWAILDGTWYPSSPSVLKERDRPVCVNELSFELMQDCTPDLVTEIDSAKGDDSSSFLQQLDSAANNASQTIVDSACRIPTPILVWRDGETSLINPISQRCIPKDAGDAWMEPL
jgi:predicted ABC-type ATPase